MAYATIGDVQARMPQFTLTSTSKPTLGDASTFIGDVEAEVNAALSNLGYTAPVTAGANALAILKTWVSQGVIARILTARAAAVGGDNAVQSADRAQALYDGYFTKLADAKNPLELTDAARTGDAVEKPDQSLGGLLTDDCGNELEPRATMDQVF